MEAGSPWYYFSPEGVGSLTYREAIGDRLYADDVQRVVEANPHSRFCSILKDYVRRVESGEITKRRGRPRLEERGLLTLLKLCYDARRSELANERSKVSKLRNQTDFEACRVAAEQIAREFRLSKDGRTLLNRFSLMKRTAAKEAVLSRAFFVNEKTRLRVH